MIINTQIKRNYPNYLVNTELKIKLKLISNLMTMKSKFNRNPRMSSNQVVFDEFTQT